MNKTTIAQKVYSILKDGWFHGYYTPKPQLKCNTSYMLNFGGRNIGKTYAWILVIYAMWQRLDYKGCIIRRHADSLKPSKARDIFLKVFEEHPELNLKKYDGIQYRSGGFYGYWNCDNKKEYDVAFCHTFALSTAIEMNKGILDIKNLGMVFFDEALTQDAYLTDEWERFQQAISTVVRTNSMAFVVLSANTVSWNAPYFRNFGIKNPRDIIQGSIFTLKCMEDTSVSVEYCSDIINSKKSIVDRRFFGFKNSGAEMIKSGAWEVREYQHWLPEHRRREDGTLYSRHIAIDGIYMTYEYESVAIEVVIHEYLGVVVNVRPAYMIGDIDDEYIRRVYTDTHISKPYEVVRINGNDKLDKLIWTLYKDGRFFYADNVCGEVVRRWLESHKYK